MVMGDAARMDDLLALRQGAAALLRVGHRPGEAAQNIRAVESDPRLATDGQGLLEQLEGLVAPAFGERRLAEIEERAL